MVAKPHIEITDYSPEWDFTTGGSKIIICLRPTLERFIETRESERKFEVSFGDHLVPAKFVQAGVVKCNAPPHEPGYFPLQLMYDGEACSESVDFEFRS